MKVKHRYQNHMKAMKGERERERMIKKKKKKKKIIIHSVGNVSWNVMNSTSWPGEAVSRRHKESHKFITQIWLNNNFSEIKSQRYIGNTTGK